jgi:hypothetical protein
MLFLQLPDGNEIQIGPDRFKVPEVLFQPVIFLAGSHCSHPLIWNALLASLLWNLYFVCLTVHISLT